MVKRAWAITLVMLPLGSPGNSLFMLPPSMGVMDDLRLSQGVLNLKTGIFTTGTTTNLPLMSSGFSIR